jgi:hypothetical protein
VHEMLESQLGALISGPESCCQLHSTARSGAGRKAGTPTCSNPEMRETKSSSKKPANAGIADSRDRSQVRLARPVLMDLFHF